MMTFKFFLTLHDAAWVQTVLSESEVVWRGVWGERQTGALQTGKGYCANLGHQEDETGLVYMRARYYEPTTGRFLSETLPGMGSIGICMPMGILLIRWIIRGKCQL